jgi:hypothetical protein
MLKPVNYRYDFNFSPKQGYNNDNSKHKLLQILLIPFTWMHPKSHLQVRKPPEKI